MDQTLMIGWTQAQAADRRASYRRMLGLVLALDVLLGIAALIGPVTLSRVLGLPEPFPVGWVRAWGGLLLLAVALLLPGWLNPLRARLPNLVQLPGRMLLGLLFLLLGGGFAVLGVLEIAFALLLAWGYYGLFRAEVMSRP